MRHLNETMTMISTSEAPQTLRDIERLEQDIQELQRQREWKKQQLRPIRRQLIMTSTEQVSCYEAGNHLFRNLEPGEQQDVDIVCSRALSLFPLSRDRELMSSLLVVVVPLSRISHQRKQVEDRESFVAKNVIFNNARRERNKTLPRHFSFKC